MRATTTIPATPAKAMLAASRTPAAEEGSSVGAESVVVVAGGRTAVPVPVGAEVVVPLEKTVSVYLLRVTVLVRVVVEVAVVVVVGSPASSVWAMASMGRTTAETRVKSFILMVDQKTLFFVGEEGGSTSELKAPSQAEGIVFVESGFDCGSKRISFA